MISSQQRNEILTDLGFKIEENGSWKFGTKIAFEIGDDNLSDICTQEALVNFVNDIFHNLKLQAVKALIEVHQNAVMTVHQKKSLIIEV